MIGLFVLVVYFFLYVLSVIWLYTKVEDFEFTPFPDAYKFLILISIIVLPVFITPIIIIFFAVSYLSSLKKSFPDFLRILKYNIKRNRIGDDE